MKTKIIYSRESQETSGQIIMFGDAGIYSGWFHNKAGLDKLLAWAEKQNQQKKFSWHQAIILEFPEANKQLVEFYQPGEKAGGK